MAEKNHLLNSKQMAQFVADGFLRFDELIPQNLNQAVRKEMDSHCLLYTSPSPRDS